MKDQSPGAKLKKVENALLLKANALNVQSF